MTIAPTATTLATVSALALATMSAGGASADSALQGGRVDVWLTDLSANVKLTQQAGVRWRSGTAPSGNTITIDENRKYQSMVGYGASFTDSSAWLVGTRLDPERRDAVMRDLFSRRDGIGLSFIRQPMGASDFAVNGNYSYDDTPAGQTDPTLANFSTDHDDAYIIPVLRQALRLNPDLSIVASPWSPPGWMKTSDSMIGGTLKPDAYRPLAEYFARFVSSYGKKGIPIAYITPNNEPLYVPSGYPGLGLSARQASDLIQNHLGPVLRQRGLRTKILGYDHNWDVLSYPESMYSDPKTAKYVDGTAWHCYGGSVRAQSASHNSYPNQPAYHTECSGGTWEGDDQAGFNGAMNLVVNAPRDWAKGVIRWNMALDQNNGPTNGGCPTCRGVVKVTPDANGRWGYEKTVDYYALGHASKFVATKAHRVASSPGGSIQNVAFVNPSGEKVLVAHNKGTSAATFNVQWGSRWFSYTLPASAAATFTWQGDREGKVDQKAIGSIDLAFQNADGTRPVVSYDSGLGAFEDQVMVGDKSYGHTLPAGATLSTGVQTAPLPRTGWTVSAIASSQWDPPGNAIDGDPATRWSSGRGMQDGDWFQLDLGSSQSFSEIVMDSTASPGDLAHGYEVYTSDDASQWKKLATGPGRDPLIRVVFPTTTARYIRLVNKGNAGSWWSMHEINVLGLTAGAAQPRAVRGAVQRKTATLPDGTELTTVYNPGPGTATFQGSWGTDSYTYALPATAAAIFTKR